MAFIPLENFFSIWHYKLIGLIGPRAVSEWVKYSQQHETGSKGLSQEKLAIRLNSRLHCTNTHVTVKSARYLPAIAATGQSSKIVADREEEGFTSPPPQEAKYVESWPNTTSFLCMFLANQRFIFVIFSPVAPHRGQPAAKCHPRWQPTRRFAVSYGLGRCQIQTRDCRTTVWHATIELPASLLPLSYPPPRLLPGLARVDLIFLWIGMVEYIPS
jgi:hypothetical protein